MKDFKDPDSNETKRVEPVAAVAQHPREPRKPGQSAHVSTDIQTPTEEE